MFSFWICSYSGGRKIHRVFRDAISTSYCLWQRDPVPCLPISKCGSKPVDRILLAAGILQVVDALLINIIPRLKEIADFSIMNYLSSGNVGLLSMASGGSLYLKALLIAIITLILMGSLSGLMMQKKDI